MTSEYEQARRSKADALRERGLDPFGGRFPDAIPAAEARRRFETDGEGAPARVAGRVTGLRTFGKLVFADLEDASGRIQLAFHKKTLPEDEWAKVDLLDLADWVGVDGRLITTRTGEITVEAKHLAILTKSLLPPPEKWHGLVDVETRYRQRYVDLFANPEVRETFLARSRLISQVRRFLEARGFLEVETPVLQPIYGGAAARPFVTHHNTLDADFYLRISPELYLKRLLVGGMDRVFEIARVFRNEGISTRHNPEFTLLEVYQACADYTDMMDLVETMVEGLAKSVTGGSTVVPWPAPREKGEGEAEDSGAAPAEKDSAGGAKENSAGGLRTPRASGGEDSRAAGTETRRALSQGEPVEIDYATPWRRATYADLLQEHAGLALGDEPAIRARAREMGIEESNKHLDVVTHEIFERTVEHHLVQPTFVMDWPAGLCPLTKRKADDPAIAERFEPMVAGMEIGNAYTELNDPDVQEAALATQLAGQDETMAVMDTDFLEALKHGMPPAGGLGIGLDRLVMLLTGAPSIRDVVLFPARRPEAGA